MATLETAIERKIGPRRVARGRVAHALITHHPRSESLEPRWATESEGMSRGRIVLSALFGIAALAVVGGLFGAGWALLLLGATGGAVLFARLLYRRLEGGDPGETAQPPASGVVWTGSISSSVRLDYDSGVAEKRYEPPWLVRTLYWIAFQAPFPYASNDDALEAALHRRTIAGLLTRHWFGESLVARAIDVRTDEEGRRSFVTELVRGTVPRDRQRARRMLRRLNARFLEAGLPTWQVWHRNPRAVGNLIEREDGSYRIIDLESNLVTPFLPPGALVRAIRGARFPAFDDVDVPRLRGYLAAHAEAIEASLGEHDASRLQDATAAYDAAAERWYASERRIASRTLVGAVLLVNAAMLAGTAIAYQAFGVRGMLSEPGLLNSADALQLLLAGVLGVVVFRRFWARGVAPSIEEGAGIFLWGAVGLGLIAFAFDDAFGIHERLGGLIEAVAPLPLVNNVDDAITLSYGLIGLGLLFAFRDELRAPRASSVLLVAGAVASAAMLFTDAFGSGPVAALEFPSQVTAVALLLSAMLVRNRELAWEAEPARRPLAPAPVRELAVAPAAEPAA